VELSSTSRFSFAGRPGGRPLERFWRPVRNGPSAGGKPDSNHRYRVARSRFPEGLISSLFDFLPAEKLARTTTDTTTTPGAFRGTDRRYGAGGEEWQLRRCI
jgi:hypothetical protein